MQIMLRIIYKIIDIQLYKSIQQIITQVYNDTVIIDNC